MKSYKYPAKNLTTIQRLKIVIRNIHEREWPAADTRKAAKNAAEMWAIADAARRTENF